MPESSPTHDHVELKGGNSLVGALLCDGCGAYVSSLYSEQHQDFHDRVARASAPPPPSETKTKTKKPKKD